MEHVEESVTVSQLNGLIKQKRNGELKSLLSQEVLSSLINKRESTLMHAAVMFNNIDVIVLLFSLEFNVNARNSIGQTPLMLAAQKKSYQAVQLLLALDADVFVADNKGTTAVQVLLNKKRSTPVFIVSCLSERLKRSELSSKDIVEELLKVDCPLEHIFTFNDAEITREMLVRTEEEDEITLRALLKRAMYTMDMVNAKVLLEYEPHLRERRQNFFDEVTKNIFDPATKPFFEQLVNWNVIDKTLMEYINKMFRFAGGEIYNDDDDEVSIMKYKYINENDIKMYLDIGIDRFCRQKFGCGVIESLFANRIFETSKLIENRQFDVNGRDKDGNSALHMAAGYKDAETVSYLLDIGADPNIKNHRGQTPLFFAGEHEMDFFRVGGNQEVVELLLEAGADLQVMDKRGSCAFGALDLQGAVLIKIMILDFQGLLSENIRNYLYDIDSYNAANEEMQGYYRKHVQDLDWMKTRMVSESISLFTVLTEKFERLARHVKDEKTCTEIRNAATGGRQMNSVFSEMLIKKLNKACEMNKLKRKASTFLSDKMQINDCDHLVIQKIIGFLTYRNLLVFEKID